MAQKRFANGEIPFDEYTGSIEARAQSEEELLSAELELQLAQAMLREWVGN